MDLFVNRIFKKVVIFYEKTSKVLRVKDLRITQRREAAKTPGIHFPLQCYS
jgi:hypothetical protein